jgi:hypothetical protein
MDYHNLYIIEVLATGAMKNYYTTHKYLKEFVAKQFKRDDLYVIMSEQEKVQERIARIEIF